MFMRAGSPTHRRVLCAVCWEELHPQPPGVAVQDNLLDGSWLMYDWNSAAGALIVAWQQGCWLVGWYRVVCQLVTFTIGCLMNLPIWSCSLLLLLLWQTIGKLAAQYKVEVCYYCYCCYCWDVKVELLLVLLG